MKTTTEWWAPGRVVNDPATEMRDAGARGTRRALARSEARLERALRRVVRDVARQRRTQAGR